jgi:hypothetical protein
MILNYINISLKCKCCVLNEEIQGKFGENFWKIHQRTIEDFSLQEVFRDGAIILFFLAGKNIMNHFLGRFHGDLDLLTPKLPLALLGTI